MDMCLLVSTSATSNDPDSSEFELVFTPCANIFVELNSRDINLYSTYHSRTKNIQNLSFKISVT